jgi:hypothetical protein
VLGQSDVENVRVVCNRNGHCYNTGRNRNAGRNFCAGLLRWWVLWWSRPTRMAQAMGTTVDRVWESVSVPSDSECGNPQASCKFYQGPAGQENPAGSFSAGFGSLSKNSRGGGGQRCWRLTLVDCASDFSVLTGPFPTQQRNEAAQLRTAIHYWRPVLLNITDGLNDLRLRILLAEDDDVVCSSALAPQSAGLHGHGNSPSQQTNMLSEH